MYPTILHWIVNQAIADFLADNAGVLPNPGGKYQRIDTIHHGRICSNGLF